jgi:hypothetical protein
MCGFPRSLGLPRVLEKLHFGHRRVQVVEWTDTEPLPRSPESADVGGSGDGAEAIEGRDRLPAQRGHGGTGLIDVRGGRGSGRNRKRASLSHPTGVSIRREDPGGCWFWKSGPPGRLLAASTAWTSHTSTPSTRRRASAGVAAWQRGTGLGEDAAPNPGLLIAS